MNALWHDLRIALRTLLRSPGFSCLAVIILSLGIGANTAIFSVVDAVLLRPLPFPGSDRLMTVSLRNTRHGEERIPLSVADFLDWRARNRVFESLAAYTDSWFSLTDHGEPERLRGTWVTGGFFATLQARPLLGRTFVPADDEPGRPSLLILSHALWQRRFGSDPKIIGDTVTLNGRLRTVVGVMPADFSFTPDDASSLPGDVALWAVHTLEAPERRGPYYLTGIARLKPGETLERARRDLNDIGMSIRLENPLSNAETTLWAVSLKDMMVGDVRRTLLALLGVVAFVLLIASLNVANLSLARAASRGSEMAIRAALGAGRARIVRLLLTESLLLAMAGALLGLLVASWTVDLLRALGSVQMPRLSEVTMDARVLGFTATASVLSALLFGLAPALQGSRASLGTWLKEGRQGGAHGPGWRRTRNVLVVAEVALSLLLLTGAGLMLNSFLRLQRVRPVFLPQSVLTLEVNLPGARYGDVQRAHAFYRQLLERVGSLPGVKAAGIGTSLPPNLLSITDTFTIENAPAMPGQSAPAVPLVFVSPGYFRALGVSLLRGRNFEETDHANAPMVAIINQAMARRYFPNRDPIGQRIRTGGPERPGNSWMEIVGLVGDVRYAGLEVEPEPALYEHYIQVDWPDAYVVVRGVGDVRQLAGTVRDTIWSLDKDLPVTGVRTMEDLLSESMTRPRFRTVAFVAFGWLALALAVTGVYSVMSYLVGQRTREIGIRVALGARRGDVLGLVIREGMSLALVGVMIGLGAALAMTRLMTSFLFGVGATDPPTLAATTSLLLGMVFAACWLPARRAARVDPAVALRDD